MNEDKQKDVKPIQDTRLALKQARETIRLLEEELSETNRGMIALATELEKANESLQQEIKERKRAEEACRIASAYNRSLIEASLDPLVTINAEGKITDVNAATEQITGYSAQELVGDRLCRLLYRARESPIGIQTGFSRRVGEEL